MIYGLIFLSFIFQGCSTSLEVFDSEPGQGVGSKSITQVNEMVNQGSFTESFHNLVAPRVMLSEKTTHEEKSSVQRISEKPLRIWIAPFQDENGDFHEASRIHTIVRSGFWRLEE